MTGQLVAIFNRWVPKTHFTTFTSRNRPLSYNYGRRRLTTIVGVSAPERGNLLAYEGTI